MTDRQKIVWGTMAGMLVMGGIFFEVFTGYEINTWSVGLAFHPATKECAIYSKVDFIGRPTVSPRGKPGWKVYAITPITGVTTYPTPYGSCEDPLHNGKKCCQDFGFHFTSYPY